VNIASRLIPLCIVLAAAAPRPVGEFSDHADVGTVAKPGSVEFDSAKGEYRVTGSGENMWGAKDAFQFVWREAPGDSTLTADVRFVGEGKNAHRKACLMFRKSLDPDAPYADVAVHGDGLISLQFRRRKGGVTEEVQSKVKAPATVRLAREGNRFVMFVVAVGKPLEKAGEVTLELNGQLLAGLAVCSHDASVSETAIFSNVLFTGRKP
jgi:TolB protein